MTIDTSYFYEDITIAQVETPAVADTVSRFIAIYEPKLLTSLMGYELYKAYKAGIAAEVPNAKWIAIRDGSEYTNRYGRLDKWEGLKRTVVAPVEATEEPLVEAVAGQYQSLVANYVYYWYMRSNATTTAGSGEVNNNVSAPVSPGLKMLRAWNQMVKWNWELIEFLQSNADVYPEFVNDRKEDRVNVLTPITMFN